MAASSNERIYPPKKMRRISIPHDEGTPAHANGNKLTIAQVMLADEMSIVGGPRRKIMHSSTRH